MDDIEFHEIANIFPMLGDKESKELGQDIATFGLKEPIWMFEKKILDGRNRYRECKANGVEPKFREFTGTAIEALAFVWSLNKHRRHLDKSQLAICDAERNLLHNSYSAVKEDAKQRRKDGGKVGGKTAGKGRPKKNDRLTQIIEEGYQSGDSTEVAVESDRNAVTTDAIRAEAAGTNRTYIAVADMLVVERPDLAKEVKSGNMTISQVQRQLKKEQQAANNPAPPVGKYRVIYADPPWKYNDQQAISKDGVTESYGPADAHYTQMTAKELCELPIKDIAQDNAVLLIWTTSPLLEDTFPIIKAWGFKYKTSFVWDKIKHNMGHYNSVRHEFLLVCTRGSCTPDVKKLHDSVQSIERTNKHSEKPEKFREIIDEIYPNGSRIELFARKAVDGWNSWGNEA